MAVSCIDGGNRSTRRKSPTCRKSRTNFITYFCIEYTSPWAHICVDEYYTSLKLIE